MIRSLLAATVFGLMLNLPVQGQTVAEDAGRAATDLQEAIVALQAATSARDRVAALTATIRAYEEGLAAMREGLRQVRLREATLSLQFEAKRDRVSQLIGVLTQMESDPTSLLLLHPAGPLGTVRSGMMLADVTPALLAEAETVRGELKEMSDLRALQTAAGETLALGLQTAQSARSELSKAVSNRTDLPKGFTDDPAVLRDLLQSADTLDAFASGLALNTEEAAGMQPFVSAKGSLPYPVIGSILRRPNEADSAGVRRPGLTLATRPTAIVTAPWSGTIRYAGPLLDYGNVIIFEPGDGYLVILAGLDSVYGAVGDVVEMGAPLGLMGGGVQNATEFMATLDEGGGVPDTETLYIELRQGSEAIDPTDWFGRTAPTLRPRARAQTEEE
jgi:septal ring factor EnvC (AmiA/AmiB activator)